MVWEENHLQLAAIPVCSGAVETEVEDPVAIVLEEIKSEEM